MHILPEWRDYKHVQCMPFHIICVAICTHTDASQVEFDPGCEAMIYTVDGTPLLGISVLRTKGWAEGSCIQGAYKNRRVEYVIPPDERKKGTCFFITEATCNRMFGVPWDGENIQPPDVRLFTTTARGNTHPVCSTTSTSNSLRLISLCQI